MFIYYYYLLEVMVELNFEPIFPKYGLKSNPYFIEALLVEGGTIPIETLVGREKEKQELHRLISLGGGQRIMVVGEAGVGKTSLVNYIRAKAKKASYFSPNNEIGIMDNWKVNDVIINTLQAVYLELKNQDIKITDPKLLLALEDLFELSRIVQDMDVDTEALMIINTQSLMEIFRKIVNELTNRGYRAIIIHYNNLDNIDDKEYLIRLLNNLRDFFNNTHSIFIFIGDETLPSVINVKSRLRQIFTTPIKVPILDYEEVKNVIDIRLNELRLSEANTVIRPHSEDSLKLLYDLYQGNIRDILNSLSSSVNEKNVVTLSAVMTKQVLKEKATSLFIEKMSPTELKVLLYVLENGSVNNKEIAENLKKLPQNISSYIYKLRDELKAIKVDKVEGTKIYYKPTTEAIWLKLKITEQELIREKNNQNKRLIELQKRVIDYSKNP